MPPVPGRITLELLEILNNTQPQEKVFVIVHMNTEYPYEQLLNLTPREKCQVFKNVAENSQKAVVNYLKTLPKDKAEVLGQYWIFNGFHLKATKDVIEELAKRDDISFICYNATVHLDYKVGEDIPKDGPETPEWNITKIMAESCWAAGYNGSGIILGHVGTGVLTTHEALTGKWLSPYWYDGVNGQSSPYDDNGHGTHTMGIVCGGDGPGPFANDIGVAYGAKYIPTKAFNSSGSGQYAWIDTCMQYLANLKQSGVDIRVINNSWGSSNGSDLHWWYIVLNWRNLGILPVFSAGGGGTGYGTINSPASYPTGVGVTASYINDSIGNFAARGPAPNIPPINNPQYWFYPSWNLLKPDFSAPGVNIRSCYNNGGYATLTGTSISVPHITGAIGILLEKNSNLTPQEIYNIIKDNCRQPSWGAPYPNNTYGWGIVNIWYALKNVPPTNAPFVLIVRTEVVNDNNGNGKLDPGENAGIVICVKNTGGAVATDVQGRLRTTSSYITIMDSIYTFGTLNQGDSADNASDPYDLIVSTSTPPGHIANFQLILTAAETTWTRNFSLDVGFAPGRIIWGPKSLPNFSTNQNVSGVTYDPIGDKIYVADLKSNIIRYYSSDSFVIYSGAITAPESSLTDIAYSNYDDALYICTFNSKIVYKINKMTGAVLRQFNNPASDYPVGIAYETPNTMWFADRRSTLGAPQLIYIGDTLGVATQYNSPIQGYKSTCCLAYDSLGNSFVNVQTWYNSGGTSLDSVGVVEMRGQPPTFTGNKFLLNRWWYIRGIEFDPRDGNYWITITLNEGMSNQIVKVKGFYTPQVPVEELSHKLIFHKNLIKIFPNPAKNIVSFHISLDNFKNTYLCVYDVCGRLVAKVPFTKDERVIKWNPRKDHALTDGVYFVSLEKVDGIITKKFALID